MAHTGRPGDIPSVCIVPAFCQVVRFAHHGLYCSHVCACHTPQLVAGSLFGVCLRYFFSSQTEEQQNGRLPLGTTEWNHSYYTGNSLSALHSLQQLQAGASPPSPAQMSASTRVSHGAAPLSSVSCPQVTLSAAHPQVQMDPTRTITSDLLSATLAEAATQLSRCCIPGALHFCRPSYQSPISACRYADFSTHRRLSGRFYTTLIQGVPGSTFYARCSLPHVFPTPSLLLDAAVQTPLYSVASHDASTQLPLTEFFIGCIFSNDSQASPSAHCNTGGASPPQPPDIATLCSPSSASHASDGHEHTTAPRVLVTTAATGSREVCPSVRFTWYTCWSGHRCDLVCAHLSQLRPHSHMSVPPTWEHILCAQLLPTREVQVPPLAGTHNPVSAGPRAGTGPFPKPRALVLPMVKVGQCKPDGLGYS